MNEARITKPLTGVSSRSGVRALTFSVAIVAAAALAGGPMTAATPVGRVEGVVRLIAPTDPPIVSGAYPSRRVNRPAPRASESRMSSCSSRMHPARPLCPRPVPG